jgi:hypothetical protein
MVPISGEAGRLRIVPANEVSWDDLRVVVGAARALDALCFCQRFKVLKGWHLVGEEERAHRLRDQADCGHPGSDATSGLVGYLGDEPVAWCAVEVPSERHAGSARRRRRSQSPRHRANPPAPRTRPRDHPRRPDHGPLRARRRRPASRTVHPRRWQR